MRALASLSLCVVACSGSAFDVSNADDTGTSSSTDSGVVVDSAIDDTAAPGEDAVVPSDETGVSDGGSLDTRPPSVDAGCAPAAHSTTDIYVDGAAPVIGTGVAGCPVKTFSQAAAIPLGAGVVRVVHIKPGNYTEPGFIRIRGGETYRGEGGLVKLATSGTVKCTPTAESCAVMIDSGGISDTLWIEGTSAQGIVTNGAGGSPPRIINTTVKAAGKDGIVVIGDNALLGPNVRSTYNGQSGLVMRGTGKLSISGTGNGFDNNKGGYWSGSTYIPGAGIMMINGQLFLDGGSTTNENGTGIAFDIVNTVALEQVISQHTAMSNRGAGIAIPKQWSRVTLRKTTLLKNASFGLFVSYASDGSVIDLGTAAAPGNNTFGTVSSKNTRGGIFLCNSGLTASQAAEYDKWSSCAPTQVAVANCDTTPTSYVDIAYAARPGIAPTIDPVAPPTNCTAPP